ncbi:MAG: hypothetical protein WA652_10620 [Xanthobacteraceae bacterium]
MCLACEQDAIWLAYLDSQGLMQPDDPAAVDALFASFPVQQLPAQADWDKPTPEAPAKAATDKPAAKKAVPKSATKNSFSCDDPTAE